MKMSSLVMVVELLLVLPVMAQDSSKPNLSGDWVLVQATAEGGRVGGKDRPYKPGEGTQTSANTVSGAAFNCGRQCTIVQSGQTLKIANALLGSDAQPAPAITLRGDGREASVIDSFSPTRDLSATATWDGQKLEVRTARGADSAVQSVTIEGAQLVVVSSFSNVAARSVTLRYEKK